MLILIPGVTGNLGQHLARVALGRGHQVRGLGRTPSSLPADLSQQLESFITFTNYDDIPALNWSMSNGVSAVIVAYTGRPELQLEGQLLLIRAAERAGVKIFHSATWNYDWRDWPLGYHESYDPYVSFKRHVELSSSIKPIYMFSGVFLEVYFSVEGYGGFGPENNGEWDRNEKKLWHWGDGSQKMWWTTERDAAEFSIRAVERKDAVEGGEWMVCSGLTSQNEVVERYEKKQGRTVEMVRRGTVEDLDKTAAQARKEGSLTTFWKYIGYYYSRIMIKHEPRVEDLDLDEFKDVKTTSLEEFLEENPDV